MTFPTYSQICLITCQTRIDFMPRLSIIPKDKFSASQYITFDKNSLIQFSR